VSLCKELDFPTSVKSVKIDEINNNHQMLEKVSTAIIVRRVRKCLEVDGGYFDYTIPPPPGGTAILPEYIPGGASYTRTPEIATSN
jgi:hypothetical protein